jgi:ribonucleoside-diphosphate reductase alpha chain
VSVTVTYKPSEHDGIFNWMLRNKHNFSGISLLPDNGGTYLQAPFTSISEKEYHKRLLSLPKVIDFSGIGTDDMSQRDDRFIDWACSGDNCESL